VFWLNFLLYEWKRFFLYFFTTLHLPIGCYNGIVPLFFQFSAQMAKYVLEKKYLAKPPFMPSLVPRPCGRDGQLQPNLPSNLGVLAQSHKGHCKGLPLPIAPPWVFAPSLHGPLSMYFIFIDTIIIHLPICGHSNALCCSNVQQPTIVLACHTYCQQQRI
jgi:hypothetical protein